MATSFQDINKQGLLILAFEFVGRALSAATGVEADFSILLLLRAFSRMFAFHECPLAL